ncbi:MAG: hypothetical protein AB7U61_00235 [Methylocystis sp.]
MKGLLFVAIMLSFCAQACAGDARRTARKTERDYDACLHGGWNHPACARYSSNSMEYYYHHDPRHEHGMAFGP